MKRAGAKGCGCVAETVSGAVEVGGVLRSSSGSRLGYSEEERWE